VSALLSGSDGVSKDGVALLSGSARRFCSAVAQGARGGRFSPYHRRTKVGAPGQWKREGIETQTRDTMKKR